VSLIPPRRVQVIGVPAAKRTVPMVESFARLLKRHRVVAGLSQERLGELAGVSTDAIGALERGAHRAPYKATLDLLIKALALDDSARREIEEAAAAARNHRPKVQRFGVNNLSPQLTSFVGRENDVAEIKEQLQSHRFVTLVGTGGCGKTRCAIEVARSVLDEYEDGVRLVELATTSDPALVSTRIARTLSLRDAPDRSMLDALLVFLKHKHLLLVLDNCEHVIDEGRRIVAAILQACPNVRVLATSRERFSIAGEQAYRVPSLPVPSAMQLFCDRAASADNRFVLAFETAPYVAEICRRLDGIPLAVELAAARITVLSPQELAQKLGERFRVLSTGDRSAMPRHRTMRALIDWSYDLLSDEERLVFRKLSIFSGAFTLKLAAAVCNDDGVDEIGMLSVLSSLVDKSLVQAHSRERPARYRLLESTREYAREELIDSGMEHTLASRHAGAFLGLAERLHDTWQTTPDRTWVAEAEPELENFRAALDWALGAGNDVLLGQQLAGGLERVWFALTPVEGRRWVQTAQRHVDAATPPAIAAALDLAEALLYTHFGRRKACRIAAERALVHYRKTSNQRGIAAAEHLIARAQIFLGEIEEGAARLERTLASTRSLGARKSYSNVLESLAHVCHLRGDLSGARERYSEALTAARIAGVERTAASIVQCLAEVEFRDGDASAAVLLADEALAMFTAIDVPGEGLGARLNRVAYLIALGRFDETLPEARDAVMASRDAQFPMAVAYTLHHLAAIGALRPESDGHGFEVRRRSARILGYVETRLAALEAARDHTEQQEYEAVVSALSDALGENELSKLLAEGSVWSEDQAVAEAMLI
jgi:predicted ATPase/DNA-binding XRE family transcriptional regulator